MVFLFLSFLLFFCKGEGERLNEEVEITPSAGYYMLSFFSISIPAGCDNNFPFNITTVYIEIDNGRIEIFSEGMEILTGDMRDDGTFEAHSQIRCFICCCIFSVSGSFEEDEIKGKFVYNFSNDPECDIYGEISAIPLQEDTDGCPVYSRYEGPECLGECSSDSDCIVSGCSSEVCSAESVITTCEVIPPPPGKFCKCREGVCRWGD